MLKSNKNAPFLILSTMITAGVWNLLNTHTGTHTLTVSILLFHIHVLTVVFCSNSGSKGLAALVV